MQQYDANLEIIKMWDEILKRLNDLYKRTNIIKRIQVKDCIKSAEKIQGDILISGRDYLTSDEKKYFTYLIFVTSNL